MKYQELTTTILRLNFNNYFKKWIKYVQYKLIVT